MTLFRDQLFTIPRLINLCVAVFCNCFWWQHQRWKERAVACNQLWDRHRSCVKQEVDTNEGQNSLAIQLQYQGVLPLAGVTAGLKLPAGFKAANPLTDDPTRWDIALANWRGTIVPGQGITLYFTFNILPTAKVGLPVLGPVALHFLRPNSRTINDNMEAIPALALQRAFSNVTNVGNPSLGACSPTTAGNCTTTSLGPFTHSLTFTRDYLGTFNRQILFDYINQVIPVIFKVRVKRH
jgi:hypothetical protein